MPARVAGGDERPVGAAEVVDASSDGVLVAFGSPWRSGIAVDDTVLVSVCLPDDVRVHLLATVRRWARGTDDRLYIGLAYRSVHPDDIDLLLHCRPRWEGDVLHPDG